MEEEIYLSYKTTISFFNFFYISVYVESQSALKSYEILDEAVSIMIGKCDTLLAELDKCVQDSS